MAEFIGTLGLAFAAWAVWLCVRIINRRERWAKRTALGLAVLLPLYSLSLGPANLLYYRLGAPRWLHALINVIYAPVELMHDCGLGWLQHGMESYLSWWLNL